MRFNRKKRVNPVVIVGKQMTLIRRHYAYLKCVVKGSILYCYGSYKPTEESATYNYRIKYNPKSTPVVHVTSPKIEYNDDIHMYPLDNSLCLYHRTDLEWDTTKNLYDTIIPWTHEWFVFYELYKLKGEWLHPFVAHRKDEKIRTTNLLHLN